MKRLFGLVTVLLAAGSVSAAVKTTTAFDLLKGLAGKWAIQSGEKLLAIQMTYEVGSNGSIVKEEFGKELSVFYRDGSELSMIHFCNAGNQPRLKLMKESSSPVVLIFEAVETTNLAGPDAAHVQRIIYSILDKKKFNLEIVWKKGAAFESEKYTLEKI
jgi:hypothetical protein